MKFASLLDIVGNEPAFDVGLLLSGDIDQADLRRQLCRWVRAGKLLQLRRGVYSLAPPYAKVQPHPFVIANRLVSGSYVSRQSALAHYGMIPEHVPTVTSVCSRRPVTFETPLGRYDFRHVKPDLLSGFRLQAVERGQEALVASPAKALLDLAYLHPGSDSYPYLRELRLQNLDAVDLGELQRHAEAAGSPKLLRVAHMVAELVEEDTGGTRLP